MARSDFKLVRGDQLDTEELYRFLSQVYDPFKVELYFHNREWFYRDFSYCMGIITNGQIAGYSGVIPFKYSFENSVHDAFWWVNLIVDPAYRGQGLQRIISDEFKNMNAILGGFSNPISYVILGKQGWLSIDSYRNMLLPLRPKSLKLSRHYSGWKESAVKVGAALAEPAASLVRRRFVDYNPVYAKRLTEPDIALFEAVYRRFNLPQPLITTYRDEAFLQWRYVECPYRDELAFYVAGSHDQDEAEMVMVARIYRDSGGTAVRILDLFGDLHQTALMDDLTRTLTRDAVRAGAYQVTVSATTPDLIRSFRRNRFIISSWRRFNWYANDPQEMAFYQSHLAHWVMADSDNDAPPDR